MTIQLDYLPQLPKHKIAPIGCIGSGFIMADCHLVAYRKAGFNPVAIASRTPAHARAVAERHGLDGVSTPTRRCSPTGKVEVVDVAVPPDVQLDVIREVVQAQKAHPRHPRPEAAGRELSPRRKRDRAALPAGGHHAGRQPEHAVRPVGPRLQVAARPRRCSASRCWPRSTCGRFRTGCRGSSGRAGSRCGS